MTHDPVRPVAPPPAEVELDPFEEAAQRALAEDAFLREQVAQALGGLRDLLPPRTLRMAEEMLVEMFTEDPIVSDCIERLRPQVAPASTHERDVRTSSAAALPSVPKAKAVGGGET